MLNMADHEERSPVRMALLDHDAGLGMRCRSFEHPMNQECYNRERDRLAASVRDLVRPEPEPVREQDSAAAQAKFISESARGREQKLAEQLSSLGVVLDGLAVTVGERRRAFDEAERIYLMAQTDYLQVRAAMLAALREEPA
jgi:hypothetical protein